MGDPELPAGQASASPGTHTRRRRAVLALNILLWGSLLGAGAWWAIDEIGDLPQTARTTPRYDPPVWAGQMVTAACSGGFYARGDRTVVLTLSAHCASPGATLRDGAGRLMGVLGPMALLSACPSGQLCASSDFLTLALAPDRIPWGHLNVVDMGAGGYRTITPGTEPLACGDIHVGARVEIDGRERYRTGEVLVVGRYDNASDVIFPCMAVADIEVGVGDSGGAVLVDGLPAGVISRRLGDRFGFTPLAEGLATLGLTLCTTPSCDLSPETADQPTD